MKKIFLLGVFIFTLNSWGQIKTKVFTLNLGEPTINSLKDSLNYNTNLVLKSKELLAFKLVNGNPYKYKYVINHKFVNFFEGQGYSYLDSVAKIIGKQKNINRDSVQANNLKDEKEKELEKNIIKRDITNLNKVFYDLKIEISDSISKISSEDYLDQKVFSKTRRKFNASYLKLVQNTQEIANEAYVYPETKIAFDETLKGINKISSEIKDEISKMYQLKLYNYLLPVDVNGKNIDAVEVTVERYDKIATNPAPDIYSYTIWIKNGLKIDISGGLFITSLFDKEYETQDKIVTINGTDETHKVIYEKNKGNFDFGFGSTINIALRGGSWVRPALSLGALFTTNQKFQILSGIGIILGKEERVVLHGGLTMGSISEVSSNYKADGITTYDLGTSGTVPVTNKFSFGHFFGVTYNFGKVKKQETAK